MHTQQKPNHVSVYQHYVSGYEALGIPGVVDTVQARSQ